MQEIMFSVAIITYNQEKYIAQTLDSILSQEHNYKYEIVIGEDCSSDNTKKIIEEYVAKYPQIIKPIYNNPNKGIIKNYFNVINNCQGKYIMECAGDDYWLPNKVNTQISFMEENKNVGMCYGKALFYENDNKKFQKKKFGTKWVKFNQLIQDNKIPALSVCIKNEIIKKYIKDINPEEKKWLMEDYPLWIWISKNSKIHFINKVINEMVKHEDKKFALCFLDLDDFKHINDNMGHDAGDELLIELGKRLEIGLDVAGDVYRLGGDEYALIINSAEKSIVEGILRRVQNKVEEPVILRGNNIKLEYSLGVSLFPYDSVDANELVSFADTAMYYVKEHGKNNL